MLAASNPRKSKQLPNLRWVFGILALVVGAIISALVVKTDYELLLLGAIGAGAITLALVGKPTWSLYILVFMIFTRLSDVLVNFHGAPSIAKVYVPLTLLIVILRWILYQEYPQGLSRSTIVLAYGLIGLASLLYATDPTRVSDALNDFVKDFIIVIVLLSMIQSGEVLRRVVWTLLAAGILLGTIAVYQQLTGTFDNPYWGFGQAALANIVGESNDYRVGGPGLGPNVYAQFLLLLVPLALDRLWRERSRLGRVIAAWALAVCVLTIFFTFSRGAFLGLVAILGIILVYRPPRLKYIFLTILIGALLIGFLPEQYTARLATLGDFLPGSGNQAESEVSFRGRLSENMSSWQMFKDHPFLGVGLNNFKANYQSYSRHLGLDPRREERSPHSLYLEYASELGFLGITWLVALQWITFRGLYQARRDFLAAHKREYADIALALGLGLLSFLITGIFLHVARPRYFWLFYGIALAAPNAARHELALYRANKQSQTEVAVNG